MISKSSDSPAKYYHTAIALLVVGNCLAALSDVAVKLLEGGITPFQYVFIRQVTSALIILPFWLHQPRDRRVLGNPKATLFRAHLILIGSGSMMLALTYLPLATANAVVYAAPLIMLPLSVIMLAESPARAKVMMTIVGFIGVLIVLRPSEFHWASLCALVTATTLAIFNIMARKIPSQQSVVTTLFWTSLLSIPVASIGAGLTWHSVSLHEYGLVAIAAALILLYNGLAVVAYKKVKPADIAMSEYSGLAFVTVIGIIWFDEIPSLITAIGILLIVIPLLPRDKIKQALQRLTSGR